MLAGRGGRGRSPERMEASHGGGEEDVGGRGVSGLGRHETRAVLAGLETGTNAGVHLQGGCLGQVQGLAVPCNNLGEKKGWER